jgi:hypothetical protein
MVPCLSTIVMAAALLGQAAPEASWLKSVPDEADVVIHVRSAKAASDDLAAMIQAMSPALAEQAVPAIQQGIQQFSQEFGEPAATSPFLALLRAVQPDRPGSPPFAVIVKSDNYQGVLDSLAGEKATTRSEGDGLDSFTGRQGETIYATKGTGYVAFGPDRTLVAGIAKPGPNTLGGRIAPELAERLLGGDAGVYVNLAALQERYGEVIDQVRQQFMAALDQAGQQGGNAAMMDTVKNLYGGLFDSLKSVGDLALGLDFDAKGLGIAGELTVKPDSEAAKALAKADNGDATELAKLPADGSFYVYMKVDPSLFSRFQSMGMSILYGGSKPSEEMTRAMEMQKALGRVESIGMSQAGGMGVRRLNVMNVDDPNKFVEVTTAMMKAMKPAQDAPLNFIDSVEVKPEAQQYQGFNLSEGKVTFDLEKLAKTQPNPATAEALKSALGGGTLTTWFGTDGKRVLSVSAKDWESARAQIDAYLEPKSTIGETAGFQDVRSHLPKDVTMMLLVSAQGLVQQIATQLAATLDNPELKVPADMPKEPALFGVSLTNGEAGYQFQLVVPSRVGPVLEKGLGPVISAVRGQVNQ